MTIYVWTAITQLLNQKVCSGASWVRFIANSNCVCQYYRNGAFLLLTSALKPSVASTARLSEYNASLCFP